MGGCECVSFMPGHFWHCVAAVTTAKFEVLSVANRPTGHAPQIAVPGCGAVVNDGAYHSGSHLAGANIANNVQNTKNR